MEFGLKEIIKAGGPVFIILCVISVYSLSIIIEKYIELRKIVFKNRSIIVRLLLSLKSGKMQEVIKYSLIQKGQIYEMVASIINHPGTIKEKREFTASLIEYHISLLSKKLNILATVGSTSPYIGLFGTVIGVIKAFRDMAQFQSAGPSVIAYGISEALINTAMGLFAAIPAVIAYNYFTSAINRYTQDLNYLVEQITDRYYRNENT
ncbi:MAG: MotA/TolQ/ExbB proton channel family protein [Elusimicrobiales bacterium]